MRIKTLLCAAGLAATMAIPATAQNVYSQNIVGYVSLPLQDGGLNMVANQLDWNGTGVNPVDSVISNSLPLGTKISVYNGTSFSTATYAKSKAGVPFWSGTANLDPGLGAWIYITNGAFAATGGKSNVIVIGQVRQGPLVNPNMRPLGGLAMLASILPVSGYLTTNLVLTNLFPSDKVSQWSGSNFVTSTYAKSKAGVPFWSPSEPQLKVGEGFYFSTTNHATVWSNNFTPN